MGTYIICHGHAHKAIDADQGTMSVERVECPEA